MQYDAPEYSITLPQPSQRSTIFWQLPPTKPQPFFVMNAHSTPALTVWQTTVDTSCRFSS
jgi:hypothetical protein